MEKNLQLLDRAIAILDLLSEQKEPVGLNFVTENVGFSKPAAHRVLSSLLAAGVLLKENRGYSMGPRVQRWAVAFDRQSAVLKLSRPCMKELWKTSQETVQLILFTRGHARYALKLDSPHTLRMSSREGDELCLYSTAAGKAILSVLDPHEVLDLVGTETMKPRTKNTITDFGRLWTELTKWRRLGYAAELEENELEVRCVAAPIREADGTPLGAVSIALPVFRWDDAKVEELGKSLAQAVVGLSAEFGFHQEGVQRS